MLWFWWICVSLFLSLFLKLPYQATKQNRACFVVVHTKGLSSMLTSMSKLVKLSTLLSCKQKHNTIKTVSSSPFMKTSHNKVADGMFLLTKCQNFIVFWNFSLSSKTYIQIFALFAGTNPTKLYTPLSV